MNKYFLQIIILIIICLFVIGCEPVSVSVNSQGEIAFARSEGVFFIDLKNIKLTELDWNFGKDTLPIMVEWSPKEDSLVYTVRENKDSQNTNLFLVSRKGDGKKNLYSTSGKVITQIEWSTKGSYITVAQAGEDSDMSVADLILISVRDGMSKVIVKNCGDIHKWVDDNTIAFIKVDKKNPNNSDIIKGQLCLFKVDTQEIVSLSKIIVGKVAGFDVLPNQNQIIFTAIKTDKEAEDFVENMVADSFAYLYNIKNSSLTKLSDSVINYLDYSPDGSKILIKLKDTESTSLMNLGFIDTKTKKLKVIVKNISDSINYNSSTVQLYPTWSDNNNLLFFRINNNYGSNGVSLHLMNIDINSLKKSDYQLAIDNEVGKLIDKKGGY